jgi:acetylornithine deacetylase/succinyl-diaminopimelate desuccinylase-like protein
VADFDRLDALVAERLPVWADELVQYCRFPSEGGDGEALRGAADWTAERLRALGADVTVLELPGVPPLVVGEIGEGPRTVNLVQHYDVQPAEPHELWTTPAYAPAIRDGRVFARGATDNKGELLPRIWAVEAWLEAVGDLPARLRFLVEGEEEIGSGHLDELLDLEPAFRRADAALIEGGGLDLAGRPIVEGGGRGIVVFELSVRTIPYDAHSSLAVVLPSAPVRLVQALASMWSADGRPAIDGLDAGIRPPTAAQLAVADAIPETWFADLRREYGVDRFIGGLEDVELRRSTTFAPTLNVQGLWSGHTGPGPKTILPAEAHVRLDVRIVPDQEPGAIVETIRQHLDREGFPDIEIAPVEGERAWWTPPDHPVVQAAIAASESVVGAPAIVRVSAPGTVPMYQVCAEHRVPATTLGAARDDCRAHAPDENIRLDDLATATRIAARFLDAFAAAPEMPPVAD